MARRSYLIRIGTVLSQLANVVLFNGSPDETVSGRSYRRGILMGHPEWRRRVFQIDFFFGRGHCEASHLDDVRFAREILSLDKDTST